MIINPYGEEKDLDTAATFDAPFVYVVNINQSTPYEVSILNEDQVEVSSFTIPANYAIVVEKLKEQYLKSTSSDVKGTAVIRMN